MKTHYENLFAYNDWANDQYLELIQKHESDLPDRAIQLFGHILAAHHNWNSRILSDADEIKPFPAGILARAKEIGSSNLSRTLHIMEIFNRDSPIAYKSGQGVEYTSSVLDILTQLINHSTYHRAQIALLMKENDIQPPSTDYILYRRDQ